MVDLHEIRFRLDQLSHVPRNAVLYYMSLGQAANEIVIFRKLAIMALTDRSADSVERDAGIAIAHLTLRMGAGRIFEARDLLREKRFAEVRRHIHPLMPTPAKVALKALSRLASDNKGVLYRLRNKSAFHFDFDSAAAALARLEDDAELVDYIAHDRGNCFYGSGNVLSALQLAVLAGGADIGASFQGLLDEVSEATKLVEDYVDGFISTFAQLHFGLTADSLIASKTSRSAPDIKTFQLPYFLDVSNVAPADLM